MKSKFISFLLILAVLTACTPAATPRNDITPESTVAATDVPSTFTPAPTATQTSTPVPIQLPVDRFSPIPPLAPLTKNDAAKIEQIAAFEDSIVYRSMITADQSKLVIQFMNGVQTYSLPDLTPLTFTTLGTSPFTRTMALSADGKFVARTYPASDHPLKPILTISNTETGKEVCRIPFENAVAANEFNIQFFPDQNVLTLSGDQNSYGKVMAWTLDRCQPLLEVVSDSWVASVSSDGKYAAVTEKGQTVVHEIKTKRQTRIGESMDVRGVGFIPESGQVAISYRSRTLLYNITSGEAIGEFEANIGNYYSDVTSVNGGEWIVIDAAEKNYFWHSPENKAYGVGQSLGNSFTFENGIVQTYQSVFNLNTASKISISGYGYQAVTALSPDGSYFAISALTPPFITDVYDTGTGKKILSLPELHTPISFSNDTFLASGNGQTHLVRFADGTVTRSLDGEYTGGIHAGEQVIVWNALGEISTVDINTGEMSKRAVMLTFPLGSIQYTQYPSSLSAWDGALGTNFDSILSALGGDQGYGSVAISSDRNVAIVDGTDQLLQIIQGSDGVLIPTTSQTIATHKNTRFLSMFRFSPDNSLIAVASAQLILLDGITGKEIKRFDLSSAGVTMDMRFSPDGSKVIVSGNDLGFQANVFGNLSLLIFDVTGKKLLQRYELKQQLRKTGCNVTLPFAVTADSTQIFTLTQDCRIGLYDLQTFEEVRSFGTPYADHALSFALSPDGNTLAVASAKSFELWDVASGTKFRRVDIPELAGSYDNYYHRIVFSPDGKAVIVKSGISFSTNSITTVWGIPEAP